MLPIYVSYFAGGADKKENIFKKAICFVFGFTFVFGLLGLFAGTIGSFLAKYRVAVNIVTGAIVVLFGLSYLEFFSLPFFKGMGNIKKINSAFGAFLFGMIYSVSLTPCVGAFLGSALMLASQRGHAIEGIFMLLTYSFGLGIPFILSAILIEYLKTTFDFIKRNYKVINTASGLLLVTVGIMMATGTIEIFLSLLQ
jgi:cytochrome c-type biogenesis protein